MRHDPPCSKQLFQVYNFKFHPFPTDIFSRNPKFRPKLFQHFWPIKLKARSWTSTFVSLCEVSEPPKRKGFIQQCRGQSVKQISQNFLNSPQFRPQEFQHFLVDHNETSTLHLQYIFFHCLHCLKFQNPRTRASYKSTAVKVLWNKELFVKCQQAPTASKLESVFFYFFFVDFKYFSMKTAIFANLTTPGRVF